MWYLLWHVYVYICLYALHRQKRNFPAGINKVFFNLYLYIYFFISPVTGSSDVLELNKVQYNIKSRLTVICNNVVINC